MINSSTREVSISTRVSKGAIKCAAKYHESNSPNAMAWRPDPYIWIVTVEGAGDHTIAVPFLAAPVVVKDTPAGLVACPQH